MQTNPVITEENDIITGATEVLNLEAKAIQNLIPKLDDNFTKACDLLLKCQGRVVISGIGKSGHIGKKITATLASTGTPSFFLHPSEALHGDLGMLVNTDVLIAISNSGTNTELNQIASIAKKNNIAIVALSANNESRLAELADCFLDIGVKEEACPLGLAPTTSTTATLALGDALAICVLKARGFSREDFAKSHPGGKLGKQLLTTVADIMHTGDAVPIVSSKTKFTDAICEITAKRLGFTCVCKVDKPESIIGIFTDGDLRRIICSDANFVVATIDELMTTSFLTVKEHELAVEAAKIMSKHKITNLPVLDSCNRLVGACHIHDLSRNGII